MLYPWFSSLLNCKHFTVCVCVETLHLCWFNIFIPEVTVSLSPQQIWCFCLLQFFGLFCTEQCFTATNCTCVTIYSPHVSVCCTCHICFSECTNFSASAKCKISTSLFESALKVFDAQNETVQKKRWMKKHLLSVGERFYIWRDLHRLHMCVVFFFFPSFVAHILLLFTVKTHSQAFNYISKSVSGRVESTFQESF